MNIGILALQGAFAEHGAVLDRLGAGHFEIRQKKDIGRPFDGLILPGEKAPSSVSCCGIWNSLNRWRKKSETDCPFSGPVPD